MDVSFVNQEELGAQLLGVFLNTVIITGLLAVFVLWRYRNAVLAGMQAQALAAIPLPAHAPTIERNAEGRSIAEALAWERATHRHVIVTYLLSVAVGAAPLGWLYLAQNDLPTSPMHLIMMTGIFLSAVAPMLAISLAWSWRRGLTIALCILFVGACLTTLASIVQRVVTGRDPTIDQLLNFLFFFQLAGSVLSLPMLFLFGSGSARLRGVAPTIFAALLVFGLAPWAGYWLVFALVQTEGGLQGLLATADTFGLYAPYIVLAIPVGLLAWQRLHALRATYTSKHLSDAQLVSRMWWLMFVALLAFELILTSERSVFVTLGGATLAYFAFPLTNRWLFARGAVASGRERPRTLLLLRTFGYRARTEKLFDRIGTRWRYFGPLSVIAAPDVVARTVDSGDFLAWLTGRVDESFVRSQADLERRLAEFDTAPDPDGRYRINEFCCRDDTWQASVVSLMDRADAIVMDLRGLMNSRGGCAFELEQLRARVDAQRIVLIVDRKTPRELLPRDAAGGNVHGHIVVIEDGSIAQTDAAFEALLRAAG